MSRSVRMVPPDWQHPKKDDGSFIPLLAGTYSEHIHEYWWQFALWLKGYRVLMHDILPKNNHHIDMTFEEYHGGEPQPEWYMPEFPEGSCTHFMMYETTSEGTPISPAFEKPEDLAHWLADNNANAGAGETASYEQWLNVIRGGFAPTLIGAPGVGLINGVVGLSIMGGQNH